MKKLLILPILLLFIGCNSPFSDVKENKQEIETLKQKIQKIDDIDFQIKELQSQVDSLKEELKNQKEAKQNVSEIIQKLASLNQEITNLKNKPVETKKNCFDYIVIHPMTLITIKQSNIYSKANKNSKIVKKWPKKTTFTTYKEKNGFVKVTGYFIHNKWVENNKEWWIPKENTAVKRLAQ